MSIIIITNVDCTWIHVSLLLAALQAFNKQINKLVALTFADCTWSHNILLFLLLSTAHDHTSQCSCFFQQYIIRCLNALTFVNSTLSDVSMLLLLSTVHGHIPQCSYFCQQYMITFLNALTVLPLSTVHYHIPQWSYFCQQYMITFLNALTMITLDLLLTFDVLISDLLDVGFFILLLFRPAAKDQANLKKCRIVFLRPKKNTQQSNKANVSIWENQNRHPTTIPQ